MVLTRMARHAGMATRPRNRTDPAQAAGSKGTVRNKSRLMSRVAGNAAASHRSRPALARQVSRRMTRVSRMPIESPPGKNVRAMLSLIRTTRGVSG